MSRLYTSICSAGFLKIFNLCFTSSHSQISFQFLHTLWILHFHLGSFSYCKYHTKHCCVAQSTTTISPTRANMSGICYYELIINSRDLLCFYVALRSLNQAKRNTMFLLTLANKNDLPEFQATCLIRLFWTESFHFYAFLIVLLPLSMTTLNAKVWFLLCTKRTMGTSRQDTSHCRGETPCQFTLSHYQ